MYLTAIWAWLIYLWSQMEQKQELRTLKSQYSAFTTNPWLIWYHMIEILLQPAVFIKLLVSPYTGTAGQSRMSNCHLRASPICTHGIMWYPLQAQQKYKLSSGKEQCLWTSKKKKKKRETFWSEFLESESQSKLLELSTVCLDNSKCWSRGI